MNIVVVTVISGTVTAKQIVEEFSELLPTVWRWRVRFPTAQMIKDWDRLRPSGMRYVSAQIAIDPWNASIGAKAELQ